MSKSLPEENLESTARLFKALGHPARLLILNLVRTKPRHGEELAVILHLQPATISHHLGLLSQAGLVQSQKDQYYQTYSLTGGLLEKTLAELVRLDQNPGGKIEEDAYRKKVLDTFFKRGRLVQIPAQLKKRQIVLEHLASEFEPGRAYPEAEVNQILAEFHPDVASLRRELVELELLDRVHGIYQRA